MPPYASFSGAAIAQEKQPPAIPATILPQAAQPRLPTLDVLMGNVQAVVEIAITASEQTTGMMFRTELGENEGMLFVFKESGQASFWMINCSIPLSVAYINPEGMIVEIYPLIPHDTSSVKSVSRDVKYAIEMSRDWFLKNNVRIGMEARATGSSFEELFRGTH
jgi:uncharacterized membrane protein (UPF0127 family)